MAALWLGEYLGLLTPRTAISTILSAEERPSPLAIAFDSLVVSSVVVLSSNIHQHMMAHENPERAFS